MVKHAHTLLTAQVAYVLLIKGTSVLQSYRMVKYVFMIRTVKAVGALMKVSIKQRLHQ
jgi:hypothetical protein